MIQMSPCRVSATRSARRPVAYDSSGSTCAPISVSSRCTPRRTSMALSDWRPSIMEMAIRHRLPTSCARDRAWARSGCLVTYAEDWGATLRGVVAQVARVLGGTRPADIPVEQAAGQQVIVNARTAKALGLTVPPALLARADEVIE